MKKKLLIFPVVLLGLLLRGLWENTTLQTNTFVLTDSRIPPAFDGLRVAQVSDLHNGNFGPSNAQVLSALEAAQPDLIFITGDMIDSRNTDTDSALAFAQEAAKLAPCYYVAGNHEARGDYTTLKAGLAEIGITVLENESVRFFRGEQSITLLGVLDPAFSGPPAAEILADLTAGENGYTIALCHRPELFETVAPHAQLVFSGHAHGGQVRLPLIGGLTAPGQGLFPKYDAGRFSLENSTLLVSRGIGNSILPLRLGNRPELLIAIIHKK